MTDEEKYFAKYDSIEKEMKWIEYFFDICKVVSTKSKDPSTKVGSIIVNSGNSIISTGYNGFPIGVNDNLITIKEGKPFSNERYEREKKYLWTSHAEENAICFAARNGIKLEGSKLFVVGMRPCSRCSRLIIQSGIKEVYVLNNVDETTLERWKEDFDIAENMFKESKIKFISFDEIK